MSQTEYNIRGYVLDTKTGQSLILSNIYNQTLQTGTTSNIDGYFSINVVEGFNLLTCSHVGYIADTLRIDIKSNMDYNFQLSPKNENLKEVLLTSENSNIKLVQNSVVNLDIQEIENIPVLFGEGDILKSIQLLPGIQSGNEGSTGFYVRGGGPDQNLILLDGVPVYNSSHLLGFFSIFNENAIHDVTLTKGGFPARFGGRLSSILEVNIKNGNMNKWEVEGGVGLISGSLTIQGPIKKNKTSILISTRRTWIDLLKEPIKNILENKVDFNGNGKYYFYDLNVKLNHLFSQRDKLYVSLYSGKDDFLGNMTQNTVSQLTHYNWNDTGDSYTSEWNGMTEMGLLWNNITSSIRWTHIFNENFFANTTLLYTNYKFSNIINTHNITTNTFLETSDFIDGVTYNNSFHTVVNETSNYLYSSGLEDLGLRLDFDYIYSDKHYLTFGFSVTKHNFLPGKMEYFIDYTDAQEDTSMIFSETIQPNSISIYLEDRYTINNRISANLGVHYNDYHVNEKTYSSLEPRLSVRYLLNEKSSFKISYATMQQNIHLLTNSTLGLPNDIWVPSTNLVKPQKSEQISLGYYVFFEEGSIGSFIDFEKHNFEFNVEAYYKSMNNLITFSEGTNILGTNFSSWEERIDKYGNGIAQGLEFFIKKKTGKLNGWIGYTLSKSTRQFNNINLGNEYPYKFDRRHDLSIVGRYQVKKGINLNATFVYGTGNAITMPMAQYLLPRGNKWVQFFDYGSKNRFNMEPYHRLDFGCNFTKETKWGERTWTISVYNLYNRKNPFFIYLQEDGKSEEGQQYRTYTPVQISLFPIIPAIRYSFKFGI